MIITCISRDDRPERRASIESQDWGGEVRMLDAIKAENQSGVVKACCLSHLAVMEAHLQNSSGPLLILEDDATIVNREAYDRYLRNPEAGCSSLGSIINPFAHPTFSHTHAMLIVGLTSDHVRNFAQAIPHSINAEECYERAFGRVRQLSPRAVDFLPFVSDRTRTLQKPVAQNTGVEALVDCPWLSVAPTHIPMALGHTNLGDDIQSLAAMRLWGVSEVVDRDDPASWPADAIIPLTGWWNNVDFSAVNAKILVVGFHCTKPFSRHLKDHKEVLAKAVEAQGFPAMCRDTFTRSILRHMGIPAEYGGCVTLTLPRRENAPTSGELRIDHLGGVKHDLPQLKGMTPQDRLAIAAQRLGEIEAASSVTTTRMHAWLPALSMGVRAILTPPHYAPERFTGYNVSATDIQHLNTPLP